MCIKVAPPGSHRENRKVCITNALSKNVKSRYKKKSHAHIHRFTSHPNFFQLLTCILSKSRHGLLCNRCVWWRGWRLRGDTANTLAGGLIDRKSKDEEDGDDCTQLLPPIPFTGLSQDILIFSMPRPASTSINGVVERCCTDDWWELRLFIFWWLKRIWPRWGFRASSGGEVRKLTGASKLWWYGCDSSKCLT